MSYLEITKQDTPSERKTHVFHVRSKANSVMLGVIKWYGPWRRYCFYPEPETIFDSACLNEIFVFTEGLMWERKLTTK